MRSPARLLATITLALTLPLAALADASAQQRRVVVSPDLNAPWVLGFQGAPRTVRPPAPQPRRATRPRRAERAPAARQAAVPRTRSATALRNGFPDRFLPRTVAWEGKQKPGTIIIDTAQRYLFLVQGNGKARRYGVGVGKQGFEWTGTNRISRKAEWPSWRPPQEMIARERLKGRELPAYMAGGPQNPLGARALYLGSTLYRIHGTNQPWSIGQAVSSGCIRMRNIDVVDLYERTRVGAKVVVR